MSSSAKVGDKLFVLPPGSDTDQATSSGQPLTKEGLWGNCDQQVSSNDFWPQVKASPSQPDATWTKPSEVHRLKKMSFTGSRYDATADTCQHEIDKLDAKITETYKQLRAAPRDSAARTELANRLDALKAAKVALEDEHDDIANWSA